MKYELTGIKNGVELYSPVAENRMEERQLENNMERCAEFLSKMIRKYYNDIKHEINVEMGNEKSLMD